MSWLGLLLLGLLWGVPVFSAQTTPAAPQTNLPLLTNIAQIRALSRDEAQRGYPVRLQATVTFHNHYKLCFAQDATDAIFVQRKKAGVNLRPGQVVEFEGISGAGDYAPILLEDRVEILATGARPAAKPVSFDDLASGKTDCQWVEVRGVVRFVKRIPDSHLHLEVAVGGGRLRVYLFEYPHKNAERLVDSTIRLRGAAGSIYNPQKQFVAPLLFASGATNLVVEELSPEDPFAQVTRSAGSLLQYTPGASHGHRVKVSGVVTHHEPGQAIFIRDENQGLRIATPMTNRVAPGEIIEAVGFPVMGLYAPALEDAEVKQVNTGLAPVPVKTTIEEILTGKQDAELVTVQARMLDLVRRGTELILVLQNDSLIFNAHLAPQTNGPIQLQRGSRLQLSGICLIQEAKERVSILTPQSFRILLRSPADIDVLQKPSWWTVPRTLWLLGIMGTILLAGVALVVVLNRRVREQTEIIGQKIQREAVLEERARIAREFHDTLEQELAAITIQLNTVASQFEQSPAAARQQLDLARNMSRRSLVEARRSVWDLRSHLLENSDLVTALSEMAKPLRASSAAQITVETGGPPRKLPAAIENNLLRIAQEALANAVKHANARNIQIELQYDFRKVRLRIHDDGCGFQVNDNLAVGGGHFGLLDMRERAEKCGGSLALQSHPGEGTHIVVEVWDNQGRAAASPKANLAAQK